MANDTNSFLLFVSIVTVLLLGFKPTIVSSNSNSGRSQNLHEQTLANLLNGNRMEAANLWPKRASKDISPACSRDSQEYVQIIESLLPRTELEDNPDKKWALALLDATGRIQTGFLDGNFNWMGSFEECIRIRAYQKQSTEERFRGQYCTMNLKMAASNDTGPDQNKFNSLQSILKALAQPSSSQRIKSGSPLIMEMGLFWGVCWMSSCNNEEIETILTILIQETAAAMKIKLPDFTIESDPNFCRIKEDSPKFDTVSIAVICLYSAFGLLIVLSTIYDIYSIMRHRFARIHILEDTIDLTDQGPLARTLLSFSAYRNGKRILKTKNTGSLTCIHGIRFFSMAWVVLAHIYLFAMIPTGLPFKNMKDELDVIHSYVLQPILNGSFSVDTFYTISGLLITYLFLREMKSRSGQFGPKQFFLYYFHRYWRLTPIYAMGIAFIAGIWYHIGDGPQWARLLVEQNRCRKYWWRNLLYIQNLYDTDNKCYDVAWYLGTDMQFYAVSLPILLALYRVPVFGLVLMGTYFATTIIATALIIYIRDLPGALLEDVPHTDFEGAMQFVRYVYFVPWCRMGPYLVGMFTGYILYRTKMKSQLNQTMVVIGWLLSTGLGLAIIFGFYSYINGDIIMPRWLRAVYGSGSRTAWGFVISWVIYACVVGHGGFINTFLSWRAFVPLSRLTYSAYLVHYYPLMALYLSQQSVFYYNHFILILFFLGIMMTTMAFAFIFSLAFEAPMIELERIFLRKPEAVEDKLEPLPPISVDSESRYIGPYSIPRITTTMQKRNFSRM